MPEPTCSRQEPPAARRRPTATAALWLALALGGAPAAAEDPASAAGGLVMQAHAPPTSNARPEDFRLLVRFHNPGDAPLVVLPATLRREYTALGPGEARYGPFPGPLIPYWHRAFVLAPAETRVVELPGHRDGDGVWILEPGGYELVVRMEVAPGQAEYAGGRLDLDGRVWRGALSTAPIRIRFAVGDGAQEAMRARGAEVLAPFKRDLQQAHREGLAQGPVEALAACRMRAPEIASALSRDGVRVGRTSQRLRNPSNVGPDWVRPLLEAYASSPTERAPRAVTLSGGRSGYVEPILVQPLCLTCHGDDLATEVAARIGELYPADRAVGYRVGDLRGVFWAELPRAD